MVRLLLLFSSIAPAFASLILNSNVFDTSVFRVTTFASAGLSQPTSMVQLPDGSLAVANWGSIQRFTDVNHDGIADAPGSVLYSFQSGPLLGLERTGKYIVTGNNGDKTIAILQPGATPDAPLTPVASIAFNYPSGWYHSTPGITVRPTPGSPGSYDLIFNVGSQFEGQPSVNTVQLSGLVSGTVNGDSIYAVTINETGGTPVASNLRQIASGIRNVAGMRFNAAGDFYFTDNAIDGPGPDGDEPPQADELNRILSGQFGNIVPNFGYPNCYTEYRTGNQIGSGCTGPVVAFQPLPNGNPLGSQSEGPVELAFSPAGFPTGFNNGVFVGFSGKGFVTGPANEENAVVYYDFGTGQYIHFAENSQVGIGQPIGIYSTGNALFIADFTTSTIYQVTAAVPEPGTVLLTGLGLAVAFTLARRRLAS